MRTDQTFLCAACAVRFAPASRCPTCAGTRLHDLRDPAVRRSALESLRAYGDAGRQAERLGRAIAFVVRRKRLLLIGLPLVIAAIAVWGFPVTRRWLGLFLFLFAVSAVVVALVVTTIQVWLEVKREHLLAAARRPIRLHPFWLDPDPDRERVRGRVRVREPITSLIGRKPCAAFRVVGEAPSGPIDDSGATTFEVVCEDGSAVFIEAPAAFDLPTATPQAVRVGKALAEFLRERGCLTLPDQLQLAEAVLEEGVLVVVEGRSTPMPDTSSYRGTLQRAFKEARITVVESKP